MRNRKLTMSSRQATGKLPVAHGKRPVAHGKFMVNHGELPIALVNFGRLFKKSVCIGTTEHYPLWVCCPKTQNNELMNQKKGY